MPCFLDDGGRLRYLQLLREALLATDVQLHAYVLMDNHAHLLATPRAAGDFARMIQMLGRQYVSTFNARHRRTGTLWERRYKACLVDSERYVLTCQRYIELNPVRARMTDDPAAYRWSSCAAHGGRRHSLLTSHPAWLALDSDPAARASAWRRLLDESIPDEDLVQIRQYLQQQRAWGRDASARWSKPRHSALPASDPLIAQPKAVVSESDPVFRRPRFSPQGQF